MRVANMTKIVRLGKIQGVGNVFCKISLKDGNLSITGVEGPMYNGDAKSSCGQIVTGYMENPPEFTELGKGWTIDMVNYFLAVWDKWHLNDMRAGTPAQMDCLYTKQFPGYPKSYYDWACEVLTEAGLQPDNGYKYGSAWLREEIPKDVIDFLQSLPETDITPAWV